MTSRGTAALLVVLSLMALAAGGLVQRPLTAQEIITNLERAKALITGPRERVWTAETVKAALSGDKCEEGVRYRFRTDGSATEERCVDKKWQKADVQWSLSEDENGLIALLLGKEQYSATLVRGADALEFTLLKLPSEKTQNTLEIALRYELD